MRVRRASYPTHDFVRGYHPPVMRARERGIPFTNSQFSLHNPLKYLVLSCLVWGIIVDGLYTIHSSRTTHEGRRREQTHMLIFGRKERSKARHVPCVMPSLCLVVEFYFLVFDQNRRRVPWPRSVEITSETSLIFSCDRLSLPPPPACLNGVGKLHCRTRNILSSEKKK